MAFTRNEIETPADYIHFILRGYPRFQTEANAALLLSRSKLTKEGLRAAPVSSRERVDEVIRECLASGRLGTSEAWAEPINQFFRAHPERYVASNIDLLESLCKKEGLDWSLDSFEYLNGMPDSPLAYTVQHQQQQNQLKASEANAKRDAEEVAQMREQLYNSWETTNKKNYRHDSPYMWQRAQREERQKIAKMSDEEVRDRIAKRQWIAEVRGAESPTRNTTDSMGEGATKVNPVHSQQYLPLPREKYVPGSFQKFVIDAAYLKRLASIDVKEFRRLIDVHGSAAITERMQETA